MGYKLFIGLFISWLILVGYSKRPNYGAQISKILEYKEGQHEFTDEQFEKVFILIEDNPETLDYDFSDELPMDVVTSDDGKVRAYIIERQNYGGNPSAGFETRTLIQYKVDNDINTTRLDEEFPIVKSITNLSGNYYLIIDWWGFIAQGEHNHNRARVYKIDKSRFKVCSDIFRNKERNENEIEKYWNDEDCLDDSRPNYYELQDYFRNETNVDFDLGIVYNKNSKDLYVPNLIYTPNQYKIMDGSFRRYFWNEHDLEFVDETIMAPREFRNGKFYIRIEQDNDGKCVYYCWDGGEKKGRPTLTIANGKREIWGDGWIYDYDKCVLLDESKPLGEKYTFENNGYKYQYMSGWLRGRTYEDLEVYNPEGELVYSGQFGDF